MSSVKSFPSELQQEKKGLVNDPWKKHKWPRRTASILPHCNPVLGKLAAFRATPFLLLTNRAQPAGPEQESQTAAALTPVCSPMTKAPGILPITPGGKRTWTWRWQQPGVSPVPHSLEDNLDELLLDISTLTVPTWSWNINSNFTFFFANEYFFFVLTSNSALRLLLRLIRLVSFKSKSENLKTQASGSSSPWSGEVEEGIWFGSSRGVGSFLLSPRK